MSNDSRLEVVPHAFSIDEPWHVPPGAGGVPLLNSSNGNPPRLETTLHTFHDGERVYFIFDGDDDHVVATHLERDAPLWEQDVVELFLSPSHPSRYFEIEASPRGTWFDAAIHSPDGKRETMEVDRDWNCNDLFVAVRHLRDIQGAGRFTTVVALPFACMGVPAPQPGNSWRANFFRIDRHPEGDEFTAWRPTWKSPPDFHLPDAFGEMIFR